MNVWASEFLGAAIRQTLNGDPACAGMTERRRKWASYLGSLAVVSISMDLPGVE